MSQGQSTENVLSLDRVEGLIEVWMALNEIVSPLQ